MIGLGRDVMILLYLLGAFVGIIIIYLAIILFWPRIRVPKQPLPGGKSGVFEQRESPPSSKNNISFRVGGLDIKGWFYLPENLSVPVPCIIMNHGFGGTKDPIADKIATILGDRAKVIRYPIGHFDIYTGDHFERAASDQIDFFKKHLTTKTQRNSTNYSNF
jgi:fermentation-respiration switch protein FrsA (DUF1100 family)